MLGVSMLVAGSVCAVGATVGAGYVLRRGLSPAGRPGCGGDGGCDAVLSSSWSRVGRVPVSAPAIGVYGAMAVLAGLGDPVPRVLVVLALVAIGAAAWFAFLQVAVLRHVCRYCMATHALGVAAGAAVLADLGRPAAGAVVVAGACLVGLIVLQVLFPAATYRVEVVGGPGDGSAGPVNEPVPRPAGRSVTLHGGKVSIEVGDWPVLGDAGAAGVVLAEMFDYTCHDCRYMHALVRQAVRRYAPQLAVVLIPNPLDVRCNKQVTVQDPRHANACEYARLALGVWRARAGAFLEYHDWLMGQGATAPSVLIAKSQAERLVGPSALAAGMREAVVEELIGRASEYYRIATGGALPKLFLPGSVLWGRVPDAKTFFELLEGNAGLRAPAGGVGGGVGR